MQSSNPIQASIINHGDGTQDEARNTVLHVYAVCGTFTVTVTVTFLLPDNTSTSAQGSTTETVAGCSSNGGGDNTPANRNPQTRCPLSMEGDGKCVHANSDGRVVILVAGVVITTLLGDCPGLTCGALTRAAGIAPVLSQMTGITKANESPFSYAGVGTDSYKVVQNHQSIITSASLLIETVAAIESDPNVKHVDIIAHSLGGVVAAYAATEPRLKNDNKVERIVVLDSPLKGYAYATTGQGLGVVAELFVQAGIKRDDEVYRQLEPDSSVIKAISAEKDDSKFFSITNYNDVLVPAELSYFGGLGALLGFAPARFWIKRLGVGISTGGHLEALSSPDVAALMPLVIVVGVFPVSPASEAPTLLPLLSCIDPRAAACHLSLALFIHSPGDLLLTSADGRRVGYDPDSRTVINELPGALYSGPGTEPQLIVVPDSPLGQYQITVTGSGSGSYTVVEQQEIGASIAVADFAGVTTPGQRTQISVIVDPNSPPVLTQGT